MGISSATPRILMQGQEQALCDVIRKDSGSHLSVSFFAAIHKHERNAHVEYRVTGRGSVRAGFILHGMLEEVKLHMCVTMPYFVPKFSLFLRDQCTPQLDPKIKKRNKKDKVPETIYAKFYYAPDIRWNAIGPKLYRLEVTPEGHAHFDEILMSALVVERQRLTPAKHYGPNDGFKVKWIFNMGG
jgi:hypothetical protein